MLHRESDEGLIRVCPYCFTSLIKYPEDLDTVKCPKTEPEQAEGEEDVCGVFVRNDYYAKVEKLNARSNPNN